MIELHGLTKRYGRHTIFADLDLTIPTGQVVGIIGPSGAGKSTLLRSLNLLEQPDAGTLTIDGVSVACPHIDEKAKFALRQQSAMVFQHFNLFRQKTVLENVAEGLLIVKKLPKAEAEAQALAQLDAVGLSAYRNYYPGQLSGGQKQRVGIARGLAMNAGTLLLDEPTSALDPELVADILDILRGVVHKVDKTVVLISHEMRFVREVADRVLFFADGQILEDGTPEDVFVHPQHPKTREFIGRFQ
ncbi:MAG: amino acid ABC transporter ATP-binding protein [Lactobacillus sp.]|jgi:ABC-type polar amino acid transport system ATPase subunit|nr:amino acid ABC transporter ATP-binding protein [Lactobacillus sp.]MCI2032351.1 amino acid ABC transporter ATP-binding protein [Lactobacillus sp.]